MVLVAMVVLGGCRADVAVRVQADASGSGQVRATVTLDPEATRRVGDLAGRLRVDDLRQRGWVIEGPARKAATGSTTVGVSKRFGSTGEAERVVRELNGAQGPLRELRLSRRRSFLRTRTTLSGLLDLRSGLEGFSDDDLRSRLGGSTVGMDPSALEARGEVDLDQVVKVRVVGALPGRVGQWEARPGQRRALEAVAETWNGGRIAAATVAAATCLGALALVARERRRGGTESGAEAGPVADTPPP